MTRCKYCGGLVRWRDEAGWYRDFCEACADRVSPPDPEDLQAQYDPDGEPVEPAPEDRAVEPVVAVPLLVGLAALVVVLTLFVAVVGGVV